MALEDESVLFAMVSSATTILAFLGFLGLPNECISSMERSLMVEKDLLASIIHK
jgi:hypothetical protein